MVLAGRGAAALDRAVDHRRGAVAGHEDRLDLHGQLREPAGRVACFELRGDVRVEAGGACRLDEGVGGRGQDGCDDGETARGNVLGNAVLSFIAIWLLLTR